jgi:hypothetical protein
LRQLARDDSFELELAANGDMEALIAPEIAVGAQAVARGCVLVMLENTHPPRIRVSSAHFAACRSRAENRGSRPAGAVAEKQPKPGPPSTRSRRRAAPPPEGG